MITGITFKNFKCFGKETFFEIKPINLIYGKNSSGKSSILQLLKFISMSLESQDSTYPLVFKSKESDIDLGNFNQLIYKHNKENNLEIIIHYSEADSNNYDYYITLGIPSYNKKNIKQKPLLLNSKLVSKNNENLSNIFSTSLMREKISDGNKRYHHINKNFRINFKFIEEIRNFLDTSTDDYPILFNGKIVHLTKLQNRLLRQIYEVSKHRKYGFPRRYEVSLDLRPEEFDQEIKNINRAFRNNFSIRRDFNTIKTRGSDTRDEVIWDIPYKKIIIENFIDINEKVEANYKRLIDDLVELNKTNILKKNNRSKFLKIPTSFYFDNLRSYSGYGNEHFYEPIDTFINFLKRYGKLEKTNEKLEIIEIYLRNIITSQYIQVDKFFISELNTDDGYTGRFDRLITGSKVNGIYENLIVVSMLIDLMRYPSKNPLNAILDLNIISNLKNQLDKFFNITIFSPPQSSKISRVEFIDNTDDESINNEENLGLDSKQRITFLSESPELVDAINLFLKKNEVGYKIKIAKTIINNIGTFRSIKLKDLNTKTEVNINDAGYGVTQFMDFILTLYLNSDHLILKQEVESNLHPSWQVKISEALADAYKRNSNLRCVIETHSEHMVLKLKQLVKQGKLKPEDIGIYYVYKDKKNETSILSKINLNEKGKFIDEWKDDFFPERLTLI